MRSQSPSPIKDSDGLSGEDRLATGTGQQGSHRLAVFGVALSAAFRTELEQVEHVDRAVAGA